MIKGCKGLCFGYGIQGSQFRVEASGLKGQGLGFRVQVRNQGLGFRV